MNEKPKVPSLPQTRKVKACTEYCIMGQSRQFDFKLTCRKDKQQFRETVQAHTAPIMTQYTVQVPYQQLLSYIRKYADFMPIIRVISHFGVTGHSQT